MKKPTIICYVAGKSGGHIIPCLTLAHEEIQKNPDHKILFFTTRDPLDIEIVSNSNDIDWHIPLPLSATPQRWLSCLLFLFYACLSFAKILLTLISKRPQKIICTGGFVAIPVVICARILAIPVHIYELNVEPGRATRFLATWWSVDMFTCFTETQKFFPKKRCHKTAYPVRFFDDTKQISQKEALHELNFNQKRKTVCIFGGSQGSVEINNIIRDWIVHNPHLHEQIQIIHQTGRQDSFHWHSFYREHNIPALVYTFTQDIALYYSAADLIICRAGAGTLFEVLFFSKPCIIIPLETTHNNHQLANAYAMQQAYDDLFTVIRQQNIKHAPDTLYQTIENILSLHAPKVLQTAMHQTEL